MSELRNSELLERASQLAEEITSHPSGYDKLLESAVESGDLDEVSRLVSRIESELSQEHFYNYDIIVF